MNLVFTLSVFCSDVFMNVHKFVHKCRDNKGCFASAQAQVFASVNKKYESTSLLACYRLVDVCQNPIDSVAV